MTTIIRVKTKWAKILLIGSCLAVFSAGSAYAATDSGAPNAAGQEQQAPGDDLLQKQKEIDDYVFGDGQETLEKMGFKVTNTGPMADYVEIGITPYDEEKAQFLYDKFGTDSVKVVEGQQAVLLSSAGAATTGAAIAPDAAQEQQATGDNLLQKQKEIDDYVFGDGQETLEKMGFKVTNTGPMADYVEIGITPYDEEKAQFLYDKFGHDLVKVVEGQQAVLLDSAGAATTGVATAAQEPAAPNAAASAVDSAAGTTNAAGSSLIYTIVGAAVVLAAAVLLLARRRRTSAAGK